MVVVPVDDCNSRVDARQVLGGGQATEPGTDNDNAEPRPGTVRRRGAVDLRAARHLSDYFFNSCIGQGCNLHASALIGHQYSRAITDDVPSCTYNLHTKKDRISVP